MKPNKQKYKIYILECSDATLYTGIATDLEARLETHRSGKGSKYVRSRQPFKLRYLEYAPDRSIASQREYEIKQMSKQQKTDLITSPQNKLPDVVSS